MRSKKIEKCTKCGYLSGHPFGIVIEKGVCSGCITHQEKYKPIWDIRYEMLKEIVALYSKSKKNYDCVLPVIGDAEDYFLVEQVLKLGLSPLLVSVNDYFKNDLGWHNYHQLITYFDVDSIIYNPDFSQYQELIRTSLRKFNHVLLPFITLHTSFPVHIAKTKNIPLIIWPQNQAIEQVGKFSYIDNVEMTRWGRREHDLFGVEIEDLLGNGAQFSEKNIGFYRYPDINKLTDEKILGIYLNNFIAWDSLKQNHRSLEKGFIPEQQEATFDPYERAGSSVYYNIHDLLKLKRVGYRKIDDHIAREIRHGRLNVLDKDPIRAKYNVKPDVRDFFNWLGVSNTGYKWFMEKRLNIQEKQLNLTLENDSMVKLKSLLPTNSVAARRMFMAFAKGI